MFLQQPIKIGDHRLLPFRPKTNQQDTTMVPWLIAPYIGKIEISGNKKSLFRLRCRPDGVVRFSLKSFVWNGLNIVTPRCQ